MGKKNKFLKFPEDYCRFFLWEKGVTWKNDYMSFKNLKRIKKFPVCISLLAFADTRV